MEVSHSYLKHVGAITLMCANHVIINHPDNTYGHPYLRHNFGLLFVSLR